MQNSSRYHLDDKPFILIRFWPHILLTVLVLILAIRNITPGTWLTGWDNLHPEFDFKTNIIDRSIFSVWQEYQGLGVQAGNAHAADLPRQIGLWLMSFVIPNNLLRYFYHFLALLIGAIGAYELLFRKITRRFHSESGKAAAFGGALLYLLNPGTMQNFYVPYEAFSHFYASLPWLILTILTNFTSPNRKNLLKMSLCLLLAIPAFYIPTNFLVFLMIFGLISCFSLLTKTHWRTVLTAFLLIITINGFWLFPFMSFVSSGTDFVSQAKINRMFTEEAFLRNQKFGSFIDLSQLKGFLFDTTDLMDNHGMHDSLMKPWIGFLANPVVTGCYIFIFVAICFGYLFAIKRKQKYALVFFMLFLTMLFFMVNENPPTGFLFGFLRTYVPFFKQVLRFPYTKFIVPTVLVYAIGFSYALTWIIGKTNHIQGVKKLHTAGIFLLPIFFVALNYPSFSGNFIYKNMRIRIPQEYFDVFHFFQKQPRDARIANLPQPTYWGWVTYDWGYRGSGFPWYGIPQPIMDRAFDVWNISNETYYTDLSQALFTDGTTQGLVSVLSKYHISYIWFDGRVILPGKKGLLSPDLPVVLDTDPMFQKVYSKGQQSVYTIKNNPYNSGVGFEQKSAHIQQIFPLGETLNQDFEIIHDKNGTGLRKNISTGVLTVPSVINESSTLWMMPIVQNSKYFLKPILPEVDIDGTPVPLPDTASLFPIPVDERVKSDRLTALNDMLITPDVPIKVNIGTRTNFISTYVSQTSQPISLGNKLFNQPIQNCLPQPSFASTVKKIRENKNAITLSGKQSYPCIFGRLTDMADTTLDTIKPSYAWLRFRFQYKSENGLALKLCLTKEGDAQCFFVNAIPTISKSDGSLQSAEIIAPTQGIPLSKIWIKFELDASGTDTKSFTIQSPTVEPFTNITSQVEFPLELSSVPTQTKIPAGTLTVKMPIVSNYPILTINPATISHSKKNCFDLATGMFDRTIIEDSNRGRVVRYSANAASSCDEFDLDTRIAGSGALAFLDSRNISGRAIKNCIVLDQPGYCLSEDLLKQMTNNWTTSTVLLPPVRPELLTHMFWTLDNYAVGKETRVNDVATLTIIPFPTEWLSNIGLTPTHTSPTEYNETPTQTMTVNRQNPVYYKINAVLSENGSISLYQSFNPGWIAVADGKILPNHTLVNNWANTWEIPKGNSTIVIFFLPQLLEWLGFILLPIPFLIIFGKKSQ